MGLEQAEPGVAGCTSAAVACATATRPGSGTEPPAGTTRAATRREGRASAASPAARNATAAPRLGWLTMIVSRLPRRGLSGGDIIKPCGSPSEPRLCCRTRARRRRRRRAAAAAAATPIVVESDACAALAEPLIVVGAPCSSAVRAPTRTGGCRGVGGSCARSCYRVHPSAAAAAAGRPGPPASTLAPRRRRSCWARARVRRATRTGGGRGVGGAAREAGAVIHPVEPRSVERRSAAILLREAEVYVHGQVPCARHLVGGGGRRGRWKGAGAMSAMPTCSSVRSS